MKKHKFTMIELLVVITVIAILAATLLPALLNARRKAKSITCVNRQKQVATCIMLYADDFNSYFYPGAEYATGLLTEAKVKKYRDSGQLKWANAPRGQGYIKGEETFFCPSALLASCSDAVTYGATLSTPSDKPFTLTTIGTIQNPHETLIRLPISFKRYVTPSNSVLGGDSGRLNGGKYENYSAILMNQPNITMRHNKRANIFMADGHVENVQKELKDFNFFSFRGSMYKDVKFIKAIKKEAEYNLD